MVLLFGGCNAELGQGRDEAADDVSGQPDAAGPPDAPIREAIDAAAPADAAPLAPDASFAELCSLGYGDVPGFQLCTATAGDCGFIALNDETSCEQHCSARGGSCLVALDNDVGDCVDLEDDQTGVSCTSTGKLDLLCRCTVP